jgi:hypothetical protein
VRRDRPWVAETSQQRRDLERFHWFSDDSIALDPRRANRPPPYIAVARRRSPRRRRLLLRF